MYHFTTKALLHKKVLNHKCICQKSVRAEPRSFRTGHQTGASSGPHLDLIRPPASWGGGVKQPHAEHRGPPRRKLRKQRCDTWVRQHHLRFHLIFSLSSSRWCTDGSWSRTHSFEEALRKRRTWGLHYGSWIMKQHRMVWYLYGWSSLCLMNSDWLRPAPVVWHQYLSILTKSTASLS